jgi:hypothetical protein
LANQDSWQDVQNILQVHGKSSVQYVKSPITQTPQQFKKIYKIKTVELTLKYFGTDEEGSRKRQKMEALEVLSPQINQLRFCILGDRESFKKVLLKFLKVHFSKLYPCNKV